MQIISKIILASGYFFTIRADTCPPIKAVSIECAQSKCNYSAVTESGAWRGNNKNPSQALLAFKGARFRASTDSVASTNLNATEILGAISEGEIKYCSYSFPNNSNKKLRLFPATKTSNGWSITNEDGSWKATGHDNYVCPSENNVGQCRFARQSQP